MNKKPSYEELEFKIVELKKQLSELHCIQKSNQDTSNHTVSYHIVANGIQCNHSFLNTQKMETIELFARRITHDYNNTLLPIIGNLELLLEDHSLQSSHIETATDILNVARKAQLRLNQLMIIARQANHNKKHLKIQTIINELLYDNRFMLPSTLSIKQSIDDNCISIMADPTHIYQMIMHLISNATYAMKNTEGELHIQLSEIDIQSHQWHVNQPIEPGKYICLSVADMGCGIDPKIIDRIFDPYYKTNDFGTGPGLGLSIIYGIVKSYQGRIHIESTSGKGTAVYVYIPICNSKPIHPSNEPIIESNNTKMDRTGITNEHILLVDDDIAGIKLIGIIIKNLGYQLTSCNSSLEAFNLFCSNPNSFDLLITDLNMPDITGDELLKKIKAIRSDFPVIICSGFIEQIDIQHIKNLSHVAYISKPFKQSDIAKKIRSVLEHSSKQKKSLQKVKTILIVDDDQFIRKTQTIFFENDGYRVIQLDCGKKVLEIITKNKEIDAIILDMNMSEMNGIETTLAIRRWESENQSSREIKRIPIIILSGFENEQQRQEAINAGVDLYLLKSVPMNDIVKTVNCIVAI